MHWLARCCGKALLAPKLARYWVTVILIDSNLRKGQSGFVTHPCLAREGCDDDIADVSAALPGDATRLGFKLHDASVGLLNFVSFMEHKRASHITTDLALEWAQKRKSA